MAYSDKVLDHYENPRNVGTFDGEDNVGTGMVGAPACGDVMKLQIKVCPKTNIIKDAKFKTFGCGSAIASSSYATEFIKNLTIDLSNDTGAIIVPKGTTAQRPATPVVGMFRFNSTTDRFEGYNGASWVILGAVLPTNEVTDYSAISTTAISNHDYGAITDADSIIIDYKTIT